MKPTSLSLALFALVIASCTSSGQDSTSGETHFLRLCDPARDSEPCGDGLACLCNTCTLPCDAQNACASLSEARCVEVTELDSCEEAPAEGLCTVQCSEDSDCAGISAEHRCLDGVCAADPLPTDTATASTCPPSELSSSEVLILGDSFFAASHEITGFIEDLARSAGALSAGERYRDNSRLINNTLALMENGIETQYADAIAESPVRVVIMNGGGSDALLGDCETPDADCPVLADATAAAEELLTRMSEDGVTDVLYAFYPNALDDVLRAKVDALRPLIQDACEATDSLCQFIDLRPVFEGNYDEYIGSDGLNPTTEGAAATAQEIWTVMQENCIAQ